MLSGAAEHRRISRLHFIMSKPAGITFAVGSKHAPLVITRATIMPAGWLLLSDASGDEKSFSEPVRVNLTIAERFWRRRCARRFGRVPLREGRWFAVDATRTKKSLITHLRNKAGFQPYLQHVNIGKEAHASFLFYSDLIEIIKQN